MKSLSFRFFLTSLVFYLGMSSAQAGFRDCSIEFEGRFISVFGLKVGEASGEMFCSNSDGSEETITPVQLNFAGLSLMLAGLCDINDGYIRVGALGLKDKDALGLFAQLEVGPFLPESIDDEGTAVIAGVKVGLWNPSLGIYAGRMDISGGQLCPFPQLLGVSIGEVHDKRILDKEKAAQERAEWLSN